MFKNSFNNKQYYTLNYYYQTMFASKVFKVSLNANMTCPNIDGSSGTGGCIFCSKKGSGDFAGNKEEDLLTQFNTVKEKLALKWPNGKYIPYFQANTNTYAPLPTLKKLYEEALSFENVLGLSISTRPDAIADDVLDYLEELSTKTFLTVELGLQSIHDNTLRLINRGHNIDCFTQMLLKLLKRNIKVVVHIVNGLPYETKSMMLETVKYLNKFKIHGIKIHMLNVLKDTVLADMYEKENFKLLSREEYVGIVCDQLEILKENIVIYRLTGDADFNELIEPTWIKKKLIVLNEIDKELKKRKSYQGFNNSILNKVKQILSNILSQRDFAIDATVGNGNDTLYLCNLVKNGMVFGFDIQKQALSKTEQLLIENKLTDNYKLFHAPHENMLDYLNDYIGKISSVIFNLGYLPGGDKTITTKAESTNTAIESALLLLKKPGGIILIVIYPHDEGKKEEALILKYKDKCSSFNIYRNTDNEKAPYLVTIKT